MKTTKKLIDLTGKRFGRLVVLCRDNEIVGAKLGKSGQRKWKCQCACGAICLVKSGELRYGDTTSCGCFRRERTTIHGHTTHKTRSKTNGVWNAMLQRCTNPKHSSYNRYGGRGITVCERWQKFESFLADMGEQPAGLTLERVDNNLGYNKENCKWATWAEQNANKQHQVYPNRKQKLPTGVGKRNKKFTATITHKKQRYYLGVFSTSTAAADAYSKKLAELLFRTPK